MGELIREVKTKAYRDDVLRTAQLISMSGPSLPIKSSNSSTLKATNITLESPKPSKKTRN